MVRPSTRSAWSWVALLLLAACASAPPKNVNNLCSIFREKDDWYSDAKRATKAWGTPIHVSMAIMKQESMFHSDAQPKRTKLLGFIPWTRPSTAYGYAQVKDETWDWYKKKSGNPGADRDDFEDAVDFVAWYVYTTHKLTGTSKWDARRQYLAYHEGVTGYKQGSYRNKPWLLSVARKVDRTAKRYAGQLNSCRDELEAPWWCFFCG